MSKLTYTLESARENCSEPEEDFEPTQTPVRERFSRLGKNFDPAPEYRSECPKCFATVQPLRNGILHYCDV